RPMPARARRGWVQRVISSPFIVIAPVVGDSSPDRTLTNVDLPAPLVPITAWMLPSDRSTLTVSRARRPPKSRETLRAEKIGALMAAVYGVRMIGMLARAGRDVR